MSAAVGVEGRRGDGGRCRIACRFRYAGVHPDLERFRLERAGNRYGNRAARGYRRACFGRFAAVGSVADGRACRGAAYHHVDAATRVRAAVWVEGRGGDIRQVCISVDRACRSAAARKRHIPAVRSGRRWTVADGDGLTGSGSKTVASAGHDAEWLRNTRRSAQRAAARILHREGSVRRRAHLNRAVILTRRSHRDRGRRG